MPRITVEFFGIPRRRAGLAELALDASTLADLLAQLDASVPALHLLTSEGRLAPHFLISLDGQRFVNDQQEPLAEGCRFLLLSADVGG